MGASAGAAATRTYGDIVACKDRQGELLIKRVNGLEGDVNQIGRGPNGVFTRATGQAPGRAIHRRRQLLHPATREGPIFFPTGEEGCVFVLGDNRPNSAEPAAATTFGHDPGEGRQRGAASPHLGKSVRRLEKDIRPPVFTTKALASMYSGRVFKETQEERNIPRPRLGAGNEKKS